jgi:hypothetical protein
LVTTSGKVDLEAFGESTDLFDLCFRTAGRPPRPPTAATRTEVDVATVREGGAMNENQERLDDLTRATLLERIEEGDPDARGLLEALHNRRAAEWADLTRRAEGPEIPTAVADGPVVDVPLAHVDVGTGTITGTFSPAGRCPWCNSEMVLRHDGHRVRGFCELHPTGRLEP